MDVYHWSGKISEQAFYYTAYLRKTDHIIYGHKNDHKKKDGEHGDENDELSLLCNAVIFITRLMGIKIF